jgi:cytochrome c oxidase cbb3-type subunit 1
MNATCCTSPPAAGGDSVSTAEIDASCRVPLFVLFTRAAAWLVLASGFGMLGSLKFHSPDFLSNSAWLTYGRVHAAAANAFIYGFCLQAALGVSLWIFVRLGGVRASQPWLLGTAAQLWNFGVLAGFVGILLGGGTGQENFELPRYAAVLLFLSYLLMAACLVCTFHARRERRLRPPQWFLLAALFWFPWIFSTATLLLTGTPVRGVTQSIVAWWYGGNLSLVWMGLAGVGTAFCLLPQLTGGALHSEYQALFAFWTLVIFASWSGVPESAPVPAWLPALSTVATVLTVVPALAVTTNLCATMGCLIRSTSGNAPARFIALGVSAFLVSWALNAVAAVPVISPIVHFTWFTIAVSQLNIYGFFALTMIGAIYHIVPRVTGIEWPRQGLIRAHLWLAAGGILLFAAPLALGGVLQGINLNFGAKTVAFASVSHATLPWLRISTLGELMMLAGHFLLVANIAALSVHYYRTHWVPVYKSAAAELKPAEVKP